MGIEGKNHQATTLIGALFTTTQQRVLGLLFGQPQRSFFATEVMQLTGAGSGATQRELKKLLEAGLVTISRVGNQKHYQANAAAPIFSELCSIMQKTVGLAGPLRSALASVAADIHLALVYGSVAKRQDTAQSDIDLLVVSTTLNLEALYTLLEPVEAELARPVNPSLLTVAEFEQRLEGGHPFIQRILAGDTLLLIGDLPDSEKEFHENDRAIGEFGSDSRA